MPFPACDCVYHMHHLVETAADVSAAWDTVQYVFVGPSSFFPVAV